MKFLSLLSLLASLALPHAVWALGLWGNSHPFDLTAQVPTGKFSCLNVSNPNHLTAPTAQVYVSRLAVKRYATIHGDPEFMSYLMLVADSSQGQITYQGVPGVVRAQHSDSTAVWNLLTGLDLKITLHGYSYELAFADGTTYVCGTP